MYSSRAVVDLALEIRIMFVSKRCLRFFQNYYLEDYDLSLRYSYVNRCFDVQLVAFSCHDKPRRRKRKHTKSQRNEHDIDAIY